MYDSCGWGGSGTSWYFISWAALINTNDLSDLLANADAQIEYITSPGGYAALSHIGMINMFGLRIAAWKLYRMRKFSLNSCRSVCSSKLDKKIVKKIW